MIIDPDSTPDDSATESLPADRLQNRKHILPFLVGAICPLILFVVGVVAVPILFLIWYFMHPIAL